MAADVQGIVMIIAVRVLRYFMAAIRTDFLCNGSERAPARWVSAMTLSFFKEKRWHLQQASRLVRTQDLRWVKCGKSRVSNVRAHCGSISQTIGGILSCGDSNSQTIRSTQCCGDSISPTVEAYNVAVVIWG